jgi:hypothetical protein
MVRVGRASDTKTAKDLPSQSYTVSVDSSDICLAISREVAGESVAQRAVLRKSCCAVHAEGWKVEAAGKKHPRKLIKGALAFTCWRSL